jgi:hypothetical protein
MCGAEVGLWLRQSVRGAAELSRKRLDEGPRPERKWGRRLGCGQGRLGRPPGAAMQWTEPPTRFPHFPTFALHVHPSRPFLLFLTSPFSCPHSDVKNKRGQHARGKKITGLAFLPSEPGKLLITSNDSRVRWAAGCWVVLCCAAGR